MREALKTTVTMHSVRICLSILLGAAAFANGVAANYARPRADEPTATAGSPCAIVSSSASVALVNSPNGMKTAYLHIAKGSRSDTDR